MWSVGVVWLELLLATPHVFQITPRTAALLQRHLHRHHKSQVSSNLNCTISKQSPGTLPPQSWLQYLYSSMDKNHETPQHNSRSSLLFHKIGARAYKTCVHTLHCGLSWKTSAACARSKNMRGHQCWGAHSAVSRCIQTPCCMFLRRLIGSQSRLPARSCLTNGCSFVSQLHCSCQTDLLLNFWVGNRQFD